MKRVSKFLGAKRSEEFKRKLREGIAKRKAAGLPFGGTLHKGLTFVAVCAFSACGKPFRWKRNRLKGKAYSDRKYCSRRCSLRDAILSAKKLPDSKTLRYLYVECGLSCAAIGQIYDCKGHSAVKDALKKAGIPRRRTGPSNFGVCIESGCSKPVHKVFSKSVNSWYGRRCYEHWKQERKDTNARCYRQRRERMASRQVAA